MSGREYDSIEALRTQRAAETAQEGVTDERFLDAWGRLLRAIGTDLTRGIRRSQDARARMGRRR